MKKRLSKALAAAGIASRRACEQYIFDGRVTVNGETVYLPQTMVSWENDRICVDDSCVSKEERKVAYLLNKPRGYLCSNTPLRKGDKLVVDLFNNSELRLFTVGRLDRDTSGLLIVTNDGTLANRIIHPSANIEKEYIAICAERIQPQHLRLLSKGTVVEGVHVRPLHVQVAQTNAVAVVVSEGKKREVRLLCENAGLQVLALRRIRIGGLRLPNIPEGVYRALKQSEIEAICGGRKKAAVKPQADAAPQKPRVRPHGHRSAGRSVQSPVARKFSTRSPKAKTSAR